MNIRMRKSTAWIIMTSFILFIAGVVLAVASLYTVDEAEQVIVLQFGRPVGEPIDEPGLHFKLPFIQEVRRFDKRLLRWDGHPNQIPTRGREFITVDTTARWRIVDPLVFLQSVRDERGAISRLDDILDSVVRDTVSSTDLVEIVRSRDWALTEEDLDRVLIGPGEEEELLEEVTRGRQELMAEILKQASRLMPEYGIELFDVRIKRVNYVPSVQEQVFDRMIAERQRAAEEFRSEGRGRAEEILGAAERAVAEIISGAQRDADLIRGRADAEATRIYNEAYGADTEFYAFFRTLESYQRSLGKEATLILSGESEYFRFLRSIDGSLPDTRPADAR